MNADYTCERDNKKTWKIHFGSYTEQQTVGVNNLLRESENVPGCLGI
jgi:hypothetical protein